MMVRRFDKALSLVVQLLWSALAGILNHVRPAFSNQGRWSTRIPARARVAMLSARLGPAQLGSALPGSVGWELEHCLAGRFGCRSGTVRESRTSSDPPAHRLTFRRGPFESPPSSFPATSILRHARLTLSSR
jgi:hypothetical protein